MRSAVEGKHMRHGLVSLWDVQANREIGVGHVEHTATQNVVCRHRWVLDNGWRYVPTGIAYKPIPGDVDWDAADERLRKRWTATSRLVDCYARTLPLPAHGNAESMRTHTVVPLHFERIELRGLWPVEIQGNIGGIVYVPDVTWYTPATYASAKSSNASALPATPSFALAQGHLSLQNQYLEHWVMTSRPFPLLDAGVAVARGKLPFAVQEQTFFADVKPHAANGSYTEVICSTWVQV